MTSPNPATVSLEPTGLDYQAAFKAMYPGLVGTVRIQDLQNTSLKVVDRAARLRREERERVKAEFLALADRLATQGAAPLQAADLIRSVAREIR